MDEARFLHRHPLIGERILSSAPALAKVSRIVRSIHERVDGTGLSGRAHGQRDPLPLPHHRHVRRLIGLTTSLPPDNAIAELQAQRGHAVRPGGARRARRGRRARAAAHARRQRLAGSRSRTRAPPPNRYNPRRGAAIRPSHEPGTRPVPRRGVHEAGSVRVLPRIAPVLVPHLRNRPFTMKRSPVRGDGETYFQKQAPKGMPSWIPTRTFRTYPRGGRLAARRLPARQLAGGVLWMVQMNCIDMNAWYSRVDKPDRPDFVLFDLDPPDGGFALAIRVAHLIREELERARARLYVKTSGADGIHVLVPIARRATYEQTYAFAERVARRLEERHPGLVTTEWLKRSARASSSTTGRTHRGRRSLRPTRCGRSRARPSRRRWAGRS